MFDLIETFIWDKNITFYEFFNNKSLEEKNYQRGGGKICGLIILYVAL